MDLKSVQLQSGYPTRLADRPRPRLLVAGQGNILSESQSIIQQTTPGALADP